MSNFIERDYLQYKILEECESPNLTKEADNMLSTIYGLVINAPSWDVDFITHAHWDITNGATHTCSNCDYWFIGTRGFEYCPHCGAKMDEEDDT